MDKFGWHFLAGYIEWPARTDWILVIEIRRYIRLRLELQLPWPRLVLSEWSCLSCLVGDENICEMRKHFTGTQTLRAGCSKAEPKNFASAQTPFPAERDGQNLISWRWSLPSPTNPVWWRSMHTISSYRGNRPTPPVRHRQGRLQYTVP